MGFPTSCVCVKSGARRSVACYVCTRPSQLMHAGEIEKERRSRDSRGKGKKKWNRFSFRRSFVILQGKAFRSGQHSSLAEYILTTGVRVFSHRHGITVPKRDYNVGWPDDPPSPWLPKVCCSFASNARGVFWFQLFLARDDHNEREKVWCSMLRRAG